MDHRMSFIFASVLFLCSSFATASNSRLLAMEAYHKMEESPFDAEVYQRSLELISQAHADNADEPWVYIAASLASMQAGYKVGSWYRGKSFGKDAIDKAYQFAVKAKEIGVNESQAYAHMARMEIIKAEYRKAWELLNQAYRVDNENFYAWFYKAIIHVKKKGYDEAWTYLDEAEKRISHRYQMKLVTRERQGVARKKGDVLLEERMYKKNIEDFPENAYMYGNYGSFLLRNGRPEESIIYYEKAIAITPYPLALKKLKEAKTKANGK